MTPFTIIFLLVNAVALLGLPRRLAPLPLLVGCCYMTAIQSFNLGPIHCTVIRVLIAAGVIRVLMRGERVAGGLTWMDKLMLAWMAWLVISSPIFPGTESPLVFNLGQAYNIGGIYFLIRVFCRDLEELVGITQMAAWLLAPIAVEMVMEHLTGRNQFSVFGAFVSVRDSKFRAQGPFAHSILAGSVGASCLPLMVGIWRRHRTAALIGIIACLVMVGASNSSGPIMSLMSAIFALCIWRYRHLIHLLRWGALMAYLGLEIVMKRPAYYIMDSIDLTGGSTGWHRAHLIESSIGHLSEWWLAGTNRTRHWMPTGVPTSPNHTDITNYYLLMGVWAGLPLMLLFIAMIWVGFRYVGLMVREQTQLRNRNTFMIWCLGAALFAHTVTCISVAYFDQTFIFMFLCLAAASSLHATGSLEIASSENHADDDDESYEQSSPLPNFARL